ncbi:hypothetical protein ACXHQ0_19820 [Vibrio antiquarius]|uniref:Uncharacterized protein n=1 Tax=Vibrio parahaemolyticus TaxID=670 RepID=A0AA46URH3_VIBPH|nr:MULTISPECIES: hypothetical protein [Vibrio harveyi group]MCS0314107.1 hypothetical protein [Vibrio diabolicus]UYV30485.1 hypothetical protein M5598_26115 [Vibrio parahaemolyticus]UYW19504.1 hypothetical protein IF561_24545 [Vibrio parahaemolyticus]
MKINNQTIDQEISDFNEKRASIKQQYVSISNFGSINLFKTIEQCATSLYHGYTIQEKITSNTLNDDIASIINGLLSSYKCFNDVFDDMYSFSDFKTYLSKSTIYNILETESHPMVDNLNRKRYRLDSFPFYDLKEDDCVLINGYSSLIVFNSRGISFIYQEKGIAITISQNIITIFSGDIRLTFCNATIKKEACEITGVAAHCSKSTNGDVAIIVYLSKDYQIGFFNKIVDIGGIKSSLFCIDKERFYVASSKSDNMLNIIKSGDPILFALLMHKEIDLQEFDFSELPYSQICNIE